MAHIQYMPGDPRLVDQLVYELKSKGIFDQFRKDCIADVDTKPAYQNLRQRVENSVATFLSRQTWQPDLNKNQLREKLRKHILDGNYLEQGLERIVDQVVNPKVASVFIPKVEDLVYNYLGIARKKSVPAETSNGKIEDLLPNDLEAVSPGSVKSNDDKNESMDIDETQEETKMEVDEGKLISEEKEDNSNVEVIENQKTEDIQLPSNGPNEEIDKSNIPLPSEEIKPENIPSPDTSPVKVELEKIELPKGPMISTDIPLPDDIIKEDKDQFFKPINSDEDDSSSDSSLRRNMSPLTPIRNFNNENSYDAQQAFESDSVDNKVEDKKEPSSFRFTIEAKSTENSSEAVKTEKKDAEANLSYQFNTQVNLNTFNTPLYEDSSNSNNLQIDYESDANSKVNIENKVIDNDQNSEVSEKDKRSEEKKSNSSHKSSHRSRDRDHKRSSSKDKRSDSKQSTSRDSSRHDKSKSSKDENKSKSSDKDKPKDKNEKKNSSRDSSRHSSSHKSSHRDSKTHRSSSSSGKHSSKSIDDKKSSSSSSSHKEKEKSLDKSTSERSKDIRPNSHRADKDKNKKSSSSSSSSKNDKNIKSKSVDKDKKNKKETDDHYSLSGRGNPNRRSTDRDSNDGSSSSKGSHNPTTSKSSNGKKDSKTSSKSESTSTTGESTSPSDKENIVREHRTISKEAFQHKPIVRIDSHLEMPVVSPPRLPFVPDVTIKKPKIAANFEEAKRLMKMRKFLDEEQKRMNQEAALLLEFQANVRPSLSQVYSSIPGPELEFACVSNVGQSKEMVVQSNDNTNHVLPENKIQEVHYTKNELLTVLNDTKDDEEEITDYRNDAHTKATYNTDISLNNNFKEPLLPVAKSQNNTVYNDYNIKSARHSSSTAIEGSHENIQKEKHFTAPQNHINKEETNHTGIEEQLKQFEVSSKEDIKHISKRKKSTRETAHNRSDLFEVTIITEELSETEEVSTDENVNLKTPVKDGKSNVNNHNTEECTNESKLYYFGEHEKYNAELERDRFSNFFKQYKLRSGVSNKIYLINCDSYEENIFREVSNDFGEYEVVNYYRNGHLKLPKTTNVIRNVNISTEISLPVEADYENTNDSEIIQQNVFSPDKSDCSFELSSDYDAKLEEMVNKTSRQEIMEIILGNVIDSSPSKMPRIDYLTDSNIDSEYENNLKRKMCDVETTVNNNRPVLTPNKIRKLSTDQITSTTTETEEVPTAKSQNITRSKYLGKAKRVGLPRPRRSVLPNSPSSDKSVENYEQNSPSSPQPPNGKIKRSKVQRYDTSDLYKPKLHFLSRRNHVT